MANRILRCFICEAGLPARTMSRIDREDDIQKREIAEARRNAGGRLPIQITELTRICINCNQAIMNEIRLLEEDPTALRLNVLTQTSSHTCLICNGHENLTRLSVEARVDIYMKRNIYVTQETRSCRNHLDDGGYLRPEYLEHLRSLHRPLRIPGTVLRPFLDELRNRCSTGSKYENENNFNDIESASISPINKEDFRELFTYCDPVIEENQFRFVTKRHLLTFLCKMRQGRVSTVIATVRRSLMQRFVPENLGLDSMTRAEFIARHVNEFENRLYNPTPERPRVILYRDGTYVEVETSSNFSAAKKSYNLHKHHYLLKPVMLVAPDGRILDIHGPYFSDIRNNDATMLLHAFQQYLHDLRRWLQPGDIIILDRGYRDAVPFLEALGFIVYIPPFLEQGQRQFTTEQANYARLITKTRWIVESRNGHMKSIFKFFDHRISVVHALNLGDFFKIGAAIINRFRPTIQMNGVNAAFADELLERLREPNVMQARIEVDGCLRTRNGRWARLDEYDDADFPILTLENLSRITAGVYQVNLSPAYIQDKLLRDGDDLFQFDSLIDEPGLIRARIWSRFSNNTRHQLWIAFGRDDEDAEIEFNYYCTCKSGARTLGTCAHIASVLWFLGFARHEENVKDPDVAMLEHIHDARNR
ncbi:hypothetical protein QAD02_002808 [Eretmocerus hayati]|uniref:Uncharacterized protein n=1 Tax=Eretmocerus hayati TaxID=131215 RepID=A0ACC2NKB3_9HYME|nr:hypothetical protein QAD02_002808 [Eretmocerus hayati]